MGIEKKKVSQGVTNKRKGSDAERYYAKAFREVGFTHCKTSRLGSKLHDDAGIDLIFLPFNVQIKAGKQTGLNPSRELDYMKNRMLELFPSTSLEQKYPRVLIHKKEVGKGKLRTDSDELVFMTFEDFIKLISKIKEW